MCFMREIELKRFIHIRSFTKRAEIREALCCSCCPELGMDMGFLPIGLDEPYRIVVGNNPINDTDPTGLYPGEDPIIINPPGDKWPPPPTDCPICYAELVMGYYYCNVQWSNCYLCGTPHDACDKAAAECKRMVYTRYKRCCNKNK